MASILLHKTLRLVLVTLLEERTIVASWGISDIIIYPTVLSFKVDGMKFKGEIKICVTDSSLSLQIGENYYSNLGLQNLIFFIDDKIECTADYLSDLEKWVAQNVYSKDA